jgi:hypothetical protein
VSECPAIKSREVAARRDSTSEGLFSEEADWLCHSRGVRPTLTGLSLREIPAAKFLDRAQIFADHRYGLVVAKAKIGQTTKLV